jgi:endonuclease YncB( thermonuclease family)
MKISSLALAGLLVLGAVMPARATESLSGSARALAGDVVILRGAKVRLAGLAALPAGKLCPAGTGTGPCREVAKRMLGDLLAGQEVTCRLDRKVGHGSFEGRCRSVEHGDLGAALLRDGWALARTSASAPYRAAAAEARSAGRGIWMDRQLIR